MYHKRAWVLVVLLCLMPLVSASPDFFFQQDSPSFISIPCVEADESACDSADLVNITINSPDGSIFINNKQATFQDAGMFIFNLSSNNNSIKGIYSVTAYKLTVNKSFARFEYEINGAGKPLKTSEGVLYIILFVIVLIVLAATAWAGSITPFRNPRDEMGSVLNINNMKYIKVMFFVFCYLEFLFLVSIARNITVGFLSLNGMGAFFNIVFIILLALLLPLFPLIIWFTVVLWLADQRTQQMLERGLPVK